MLVVVRVWVPVVGPGECTAVDPHAAANGETDAKSAPHTILDLIDRLLVLTRSSGTEHHDLAGGVIGRGGNVRPPRGSEAAGSAFLLELAGAHMV